MNNENFHPVLREPPLAHALHFWDEARRELTYEYNGRDLLTFQFDTVPPGLGFRHGSDGSLNNRPCIQQIYVMADEVQTVRLKVRLSAEAVNLRPHRARGEQAILGQVGTPLMHGVNGLYDIEQDLLIDWNGQPWSWVSKSLVPGPDGGLEAELLIEVGPKPLFLNLRMHYYRHHLGYAFHKPWERRPDPKSVTGWCSWEAFRRDVNQKDMDQVADFFGKSLGPWGFEYLQLDDGFQKMPIPYEGHQRVADGWLATNGQFPGGHRAIVDTVEKNGLVAGVWTNANITNPAFAQAQADCLIRDAEGKPMLGEWIDYLLDCSPDSLERHVAPYYEGLKNLGYRYFKTDAIRHLLLDGLHEAVRQGLMTNDDAEARFRAFMETARKAIGDDSYFLASWGVMGEVIGLVDACRIAMDANPTWAGIRMQLVESARWFATQRILFLNDPDHICARANLDWVRSIVSLVSLSGSLYMLSDPLDAYDAPRVELIRKTIPTLKTVAGETGPLDLDFPAFTWTKLHGFAVPREAPVKAEGTTVQEALNMAGDYPTMHAKHPFSTLWAFHLQTEDRRWTVVGRFATVPLAASAVFLADLALDPTAEYLAYDFWNQKFLGRVRGKWSCPALELGHCQVVSLVPVAAGPQLIGSSRHLSMDAVSVLGHRWNASAETLTLVLSAVPGTPETYSVHLPQGYALTSVEAQGAEVSTGTEGEVLTLGLAPEAQEVRVTLRFRVDSFLRARLV